MLVHCVELTSRRVHSLLLTTLTAVKSTVYNFFIKPPIFCFLIISHWHMGSMFSAAQTRKFDSVIVLYWHALALLFFISLCYCYKPVVKAVLKFGCVCMWGLCHTQPHCIHRTRERASSYMLVELNWQLMHLLNEEYTKLNNCSHYVSHANHWQNKTLYVFLYFMSHLFHLQWHNL